MIYIDRHFGTWRGLVRLLLAYAELVVGCLRPFTRVDFARVKRLVFVCQGNVCRSAYAEYRSRTLNLPSASFGLAASSGTPVFSLAAATAKLRGIEMTGHSAIAMNDFELKSGDLLLVMEVHQARRLQRVVKRNDVQISLLGLWGNPIRPHIHDPYGLTAAYFGECFKGIDSALQGLSLAGACSLVSHQENALPHLVASDLG